MVPMNVASVVQVTLRGAGVKSQMFLTSQRGRN